MVEKIVLDLIENNSYPRLWVRDSAVERSLCLCVQSQPIEYGVLHLVA